LKFFIQNKMLKKSILIFLVFHFTHGEYMIPPVRLSSAPYDIWAHYHWVWLANPQENQEAILKLVSDYQSYNIPVGAVNIDSSWPSTYQNFLWNLEKFPNASVMVDQLHSQNIKVICWITSTINEDSTNFAYGLKNGYYLNKGKLVSWWRGKGALLDYTNPNAVNWWHEQMDYLLDIGVDGWKCDGTDPYVFELIYAEGYNGHVTYREYADAYYRDFFYYTQKKRGSSGLIMARPVDNFENLIYLDYAPHDVMFSGWVGDQDGTWKGIKVALNNMLRSAWNNYLNFGSDIGGYRTDGSQLGRSKEVFLRWAQLGAFLPLMENGGGGEHRPWIFGDDALEIYRLFAIIHTNLAPYLLNTGTKNYAKNISSIKPLADRVIVGEPSSYDYLLGDKIYVSPFTDNSTNKDLEFPGEISDLWVYVFDTDQTFSGKQKVNGFPCPYNEFPAFFLSGSIIPLQVDNHYSGLGSSRSKDFITIMIARPKRGTHIENIHEFQSSGYQVGYNFNEENEEIQVTISAHPRNRFIILLTGVDINEKPLILANSMQLALNSNETDFWDSTVNEAFYRLLPKSKQFFVKIIDSVEKGLILSIKGIKLSPL
jgi:alpha-glucosidase (family GH31 glycosyl hydrolase)